MPLPLLELLLTTPLTTEMRADWHATADGLFASWPADRDALSDQAPDDDVYARVFYALSAAITATERHVSPRPGYGSAHLKRVLTWALGIAHNDGLDRLDAVRLLLAAAFSDLGQRDFAPWRGQCHHLRPFRRANRATRLCDAASALCYSRPQQRAA